MVDALSLQGVRFLGVDTRILVDHLGCDDAVGENLGQ